MSNTIKTLTLLIFVWLRAVSAWLYQIPDVKIEVYYPRGLRVMIPHEENMQLFAFHGNINRPMRDYEIGQYYKDVLRPINGSWIYEDKVVRLRKGDKLYYWLYVLHDRLGYRKDNQVLLIDEMIKGGMPELMADNDDQFHSLSVKPNEIVYQNEKYAPKSTTMKTTETTMEQRIDNDLQTCNQLVVNLTFKLIKSLTELESTKKINDLLVEMVQSRSDYKKLTMRGRLSLTEPAIAVVELVLREKLDLLPNVTFAERNKDRSITFELADLRQTLEVISTAKDKLANSTAVSITY